MNALICTLQSGVSGDSGCSESTGSGVGGSGSNMERKKRKADEDEEELRTSKPQLESVTKHRVKGPAGRDVIKFVLNTIFKEEEHMYVCVRKGNILTLNGPGKSTNCS